MQRIPEQCSARKKDRNVERVRQTGRDDIVPI